MVYLNISYGRAHGNGNSAKIKDEIDKLKNQIVASNTRLNQISRDYSAITKYLKDRTLQRGVCQTMPVVNHHPCVNCSCVEDFNLVQKYFCL